MEAFYPMFILIIGAVVVALIIKGRPNKLWTCTQCGFTGKPKTKFQGSVGVELLLWLFFILPGLIYTFWRASRKIALCPSCGNQNMIPSDSPMAKKLNLAAESESDEQSTKDCPFCAETVKKAAILCKHCGKDLT